MSGREKRPLEPASRLFLIYSALQQVLQSKYIWELWEMLSWDQHWEQGQKEETLEKLDGNMPV